MNKMDELRRIYESTEIPPELSDMVNQALHQGEHENKIRTGMGTKETTQGDKKMSESRDNQTDRMKNRGTFGGHKRLYRNLTAAAAAFAVMVGAFGYGVSTNEAFADSVSSVPILSSLARVFLGEQISEADDVVKVDMKLPKVEGLTDKAVEDQINKDIHDKMTAVVANAKKEAAEDKKAWLETGGKEEDYMLREVTVDYEVKAITDNVLSFIVTETETRASAYYNMYYYNIDLNTNKELTLKDLLGDGWIAAANKQISGEIAVRSQNPDAMYFDGSEGIDGFSTISADQSFYVNQAGNPVIVFNKYEIAPGYMGIQEFEITK